MADIEIPAEQVQSSDEVLRADGTTGTVRDVQEMPGGGVIATLTDGKTIDLHGIVQVRRA